MLTWNNTVHLNMVIITIELIYINKRNKHKIKALNKINISKCKKILYKGFLFQLFWNKISVVLAKF